MFTVKTSGNRVSVVRDDHRTSFVIGPTAFTLTRTDESDPRVPIVRELELLGRLLHRLYPEVPPEPQRGRWFGPPSGLVRQFVRLCAALAPVLERARTRAGERVVSTQEAVLAQIGEVPPLLVAPEFYADPYLPEELLRYPAALVAVGSLTLGDQPPAAIRKLRRWRSLFSPSGRSYKSLNLTLDAVSGDSPLHLLTQLRRITLRRPILDPRHLTVLLRAVRSVAKVHLADIEPVLRLITNASLADFEVVSARLQDHYNMVGPELTRPLIQRRFARLVLSVPVKRGVRLPGLVDAGIALERAAQIRHSLLQVGGPERATAYPPIRVPDHPGVRFLSSVGDIIAESERMHHCIHEYARGAVFGDLYLFHVEHEGEHATAQVDAEGELVAVSGPCNRDNAAVEHAEELLLPWCRTLRKRLEAGPSESS